MPSVSLMVASFRYLPLAYFSRLYLWSSSHCPIHGAKTKHDITKQKRNNNKNINFIFSKNVDQFPLCGTHYPHKHSLPLTQIQALPSTVPEDPHLSLLQPSSHPFAQQRLIVQNKFQRLLHTLKYLDLIALSIFIAYPLSIPQTFISKHT